MKKSLALVSTLTLTCLYGLLVAIVLLFCALTDTSALSALLISLIILIIQFLISPWLTDLSMKWFYNVNFNYDVPEYLDSFINEICEKYGMKHPKIGFIDDGAPNAFTYGRFRNAARIIITRGITDLLNEDEVVSVVGHEMGHVVHRDMLLMTAAQVVPLILYAIYELAFDIATDTKIDTDSSSDSDDGKSQLVLMAIGIIAFILYLICQLIILWLSRTREYYADEFSCRETRKPSSLASALVTIGFGLATIGKEETDNKHAVTSPSTIGIADGKSSKAMAVCCASGDNEDIKSSIRNAMKWDMWNVWAKVYELVSTHPLISKRLLAISEICPEYGEEKYISFDLEKPAGCGGNFAKEILIDGVPSWAFIIAIIVALFADNTILVAALFLIACVLALLKYIYKHPTKGLEDKYTVRDLLGEYNVSGITAIPCEVSGEIIGRGNPGCVFNEDFVIKDSTGIVMLDYNQPVGIVNKFFALFKLKQNFGKTVKVNGWYRRAPVPYIEIYTYEIDGKVKKVWTYKFNLVIYAIMIALCIIIPAVILI